MLTTDEPLKRGHHEIRILSAFPNAGTVRNRTLGFLGIATASLIASLNGFGNCFHMFQVCSARLIGIFQDGDDMDGITSME